MEVVLILKQNQTIVSTEFFSKILETNGINKSVENIRNELADDIQSNTKLFESNGSRSMDI